MQLLAGEPFCDRRSTSSRRPSIAPPRLGWELRDDAAMLVAAGAVSTAELGWDDGTRTLPLRFDVGAPAVRGRTPASPRRPHRRAHGEHAVPLARRRARLRRLSVRTRAAASSGWKDAGRLPAAELERSHEQPHLPRLARSDGDRARAPVQALHRRRGAAARRRADEDLAGRARPTSRSAATSTRTSSTRRTPTRRSPRRCGRATGTRCASGSRPAAPARATRRGVSNGSPRSSASTLSTTSARHRRARLDRPAADVRREHDVRERAQRVRNVRLVHEDVEPGADAARHELGDERVLVDDRRRARCSRAWRRRAAARAARARAVRSSPASTACAPRRRRLSRSRSSSSR